MKQIKVSEATPTQLDWLVAKCEGLRPYYTRHWAKPSSLDDRKRVCVTIRGTSHLTPFEPASGNWSQMGPIIERQEIELLKWSIDGWEAKDTNYKYLNTPQEESAFAEGYGPTPLIAAARCYVASRLGDTVEVPEELT